MPSSAAAPLDPPIAWPCELEKTRGTYMMRPKASESASAAPTEAHERERPRTERPDERALDDALGIASPHSGRKHAPKRVDIPNSSGAAGGTRRPAQVRECGAKRRRLPETTVWRRGVGKSARSEQRCDIGLGRRCRLCRPPLRHPGFTRSLYRPSTPKPGARERSGRKRPARMCLAVSARAPKQAMDSLAYLCIPLHKRRAPCLPLQPLSDR